MRKNKQIVRLTESQLHGIIAESVSQILKEYGETPHGQYQIGRAVSRAERIGDMETADKLRSWSPVPKDEPYSSLRRFARGQGEVDQDRYMDAVDDEDFDEMQMRRDTITRTMPYYLKNKNNAPYIEDMPPRKQMKKKYQI